MVSDTSKKYAHYDNPIKLEELTPEDALGLKETKRMVSYLRGQLNREHLHHFAAYFAGKYSGDLIYRLVKETDPRK